MASIFTYDPDPPRVASPWLSGAESQGPDRKVPDQRTRGREQAIDLRSLSIREQSHDGAKVTRLQPEPQAGPVEYKLHLLLRPRRRFKSTSTGDYISGSKHSQCHFGPLARSTPEPTIDSSANPGNATPPSASSQQTRQHRLEQLTTQLLWRLQQSSPYHTSSATNIILPSLPEALPELQAPQQLARLLHGLEESQGALYEIGVSDDGTLVGLAEDELQESLNNLRAMAACLGCTVEILRKETVGECEWIEEMVIGRRVHQVRRSGKLVVAEALVKPLLQAESQSIPGITAIRHGNPVKAAPTLSAAVPLSTEQLRVTLTGPTTSGKSTLLGTLTTSTLDNGRGKSRLSMLKHRHEITSGMTSSVTQELLGYRDGDRGSVEVINYAAENIASWSDVHVASSESRMVLISDSAGHPRYRRTTLRGLVGWAPHWTLLCIPADDKEDTAGRAGSTIASQATLGTSMPDMDLSRAQLDLCLRLALPLVVVITKLDLASRAGLRESLSKVLDSLKAAGRRPAIMPNTPGAVAEEDLQSIGNEMLEAACNAAVPLLSEPREVVPIVLTSAVDGTGIRNLHALLHELPIPDPPSGGPIASSPREIFAIEDTYNKPAEVAGIIVSGRLRCGHIAVGDSLLIGPFSGQDHQEDSEDSDERPPRNKRVTQALTSRSFPGALKDSHLTSPYLQLHSQEWRRVTVVSIRNLRLPVHSLHTDQVGTIAVIPTQQNGSVGDGRAPAVGTTSLLSRIRKGMVLASIQPLATRTLSARFKREDLESLAVGNQAVLYIGSIRASAKVISARAPDSPDLAPSNPNSTADEQDSFAFDDFMDADQASARVAGVITAPELVVTFSFDAGKEFVMLGDQVLVMPGGGPGLFGGHERGEKGMAGLEGFVGEVVEVAR